MELRAQALVASVWNLKTKTACF